jgi:hypothetical protein
MSAGAAWETVTQLELGDAYIMLGQTQPGNTDIMPGPYVPG